MSLEPEPQSPSQDFDRWIVPPIRDCFFLTGATASGKTPLAMQVAEEFGAEIISLDSMAIYRGMDIGTAKPTKEQQDQITHHLIDIVDPDSTFSVSAYVTAAHNVAKDIKNRGRQVLFCGGTPLYLKSLLRGLFLGPQADWDFRKAVEQDLEQFGQDALLARLEQVDPLLAHKLHPNDHRRIIRALEVASLTSKPLSHWQQQFENPASDSGCKAAVIGIDRAWLHERINQRVQNMIEAGLVAEVEGLLDAFGSLGRTASQAVGYKEVIAHLCDSHPLEQTVEDIRAHTRQFARRQEIWFRGLPELNVVPVSPESTVSDSVQKIRELFGH